MPENVTSLAAHERARDEWFARLLRRLEADSRIRAAWLSGSHGRDEEDAWSDFDLHVAVSDESLPEMLANPAALFSLGGDVLLTQANFPSDSMPEGRFWLVIYPGPMHVDWNIGPASAAARPRASRLLFERECVPFAVDPPPMDPEEVRVQAQRTLEFFWAMAPIAVKYAGRGWTEQAVKQIGLLSHAFVPLWRWAQGPPFTGDDRYDQNHVPEPALRAAWPVLDAQIDAISTIEAIREYVDAVERLHQSLFVIGVTTPDAMPAQVRKLIDTAREEAHAGAAQRGTGRFR